MKQNYSIIKLFMLTIMAFFAGNAMAEDIIWQEDFSSFEDSAVPSGGTYNYVCEGTVFNDDGTVKSGTKIYSQNTAGGTAPELLVAKSGGSFSITFTSSPNSLRMLVKRFSISKRSSRFFFLSSGMTFVQKEL